MFIPPNKSTINIFNINVSTKSMDETIEYIFSQPQDRETAFIREDLNAFKVVLKQQHTSVADALNEADIVNADGMSIAFAVRLIYGLRVPRVTGCDLFIRLLSECHLRNKKIYLLGATDAVLSTAVSKIHKNHSSNIIAGYRNGYFSLEDWDGIISDITQSHTDFLFVGTPSPQKELFLNYAKKTLPANIVLMGVGGSFDVLAGKVQRAPLWLQQCGLEWFFRLIQEPRKMWKRYLITNIQFIWLLLKEKSSRHKI